MSPRVALHHATSYRYDRPVSLSPHEVRLRPAPHSRTPVLSYSLSVVPASHFINWQQDPYGNHVARLVFSEKTRELCFTVELVADLAVINPFDFFIELYAETFPFRYSEQLQLDLTGYTQPEPAGSLLAAWLDRLRSELLAQPLPTTQFLVALNQRLAREIDYLVRMEPGVQLPEETLQLGRGSCRDSTWLLVQILRQLGLGARFVSGYLIQLKAPVAPLEGAVRLPGPDSAGDSADSANASGASNGPKTDSADLHAWAEVYIPGAGWIGLDPTSGLLTGEGHIPLACSAVPTSAAPISGRAEPAEVRFHHEMRVTRLPDSPG